MPAVHKKVDVDGVFSAWVQETLKKHRVRMQEKTMENTLENIVFVGKMHIEHRVFATFSDT